MDLDAVIKWGPFWFTLLASIIAAYNSGFTSRRRLSITTPEDGIVHGEYEQIGGIGAPSGWPIVYRVLQKLGFQYGWSILVLHRTNRWYLQEGAVPPPHKNGYWLHEKCHFDNSAIGVNRTVVAIAIKTRKVELLRNEFDGWGRAGNKIMIADWEALLAVLHKIVGHRFEVSEFTRIRRI